MKELPFAELSETWRDDSSSGEYIAIDDKSDAYYHGKLIAPAKRKKERNGFEWRDTGQIIGPDWKAIRQWCEEQKYWPNIWQSNDHGNVSLYTNRGRYLGGDCMTAEKANKIYDILVVKAGARELDRNAFVHEFTGENPTREWRFCGKLGFGGKFYLHSIAVSCYREDMTPEREAIIAETNEALGNIC